jgi:hypothetical protein
VNTASLTDGTGNQVPKAVLSIDNGSQVATNVSSTNALPVTGTVSIGTGTNAIGVVSLSTSTANIVTLSTANNVVINGAGTALMGQVIAGQSATGIYNGTAALTPMFASVAFTASLGNTVISGVANKNIYVLGGCLIASTATNLQFWSTSTAGTAITGVLTMTANMGFTLPYCPIGHFVTQATGQPIQLSTSASGTVGGWLTYVAY